MYLSSGTLLQGGKYKIVRFISAGGFGCTYEAIDTLMESHVAIKEFFVKDFCVRDDATSRITLTNQGKRELLDKLRHKFLDEARALFKMKHDNIVRVNNLFEENDTAYYVMEYVDGSSLSDILKTRGTLSESEMLGYIRQLASALKYVHQQNRLHLDIKPGNILIDKNGKVVLIDFGASKHYDEGTGENTTTMQGLNTPGYAPYEQTIVGVKSFSPASDIYALGATMYKMLTGMTPPNSGLLMSKKERLAPLQESISASTRKAVAAAMQLHENDRPQSIDDFMKILEAGRTSSFLKIFSAIRKCFARKDAPKVQMQFDNASGFKSTNDSDTKNINVTPGPTITTRKKPVNWKLFGGIAAAVVVALMAMFAMNKIGKTGTPTGSEVPDSTAVAKTETFNANGVDFNMVFVNGGTFTMGATPEQGSDVGDDEKPAHDVTLSDYYIGETEVTQALWQAVMGSNPSEFKGDNNPVETVSWDDCQTFIKKLNDATGKTFCLPTEAQWEYAARGGSLSQGYKFSGSNNVDEVAWYWQNSGDNYLQGTDDDWDWDKIVKNHGKTHPVATKSPNELGIYDMSGNVREWCSDWYDDNYYKNSSTNNPTGPNTGSARVNRGGDRLNNARLCRVSYRSSDTHTPSNKSSLLGLRLLLVP